MEQQGSATATLHAHFSVNHLPQPQRYDVWRDSIACIFDVEPGRRQAYAEDGGFHASIDAHMIGPLFLATTTTRSQNWCRSAQAMARDGMDHYMLQLYESGTQRCSWQHGSFEMPDDGILVYDLSQEMRAETSDFSNVSLILPRQMIGELLQAPDDQHMRQLNGREPLVALLREHMLGLKRHAATLDLPQAMALTPIITQLVAACLNTSAASGRPDGGPGSAVQLTLLRRDIEMRLGDTDLSPADLRARHGLSRSRLYEIFAPLGGISGYIRERRLRRALLALVDPAMISHGIGEIALASGFRSISDFSRAFQRRYGLSPRVVRHRGLQQQSAGMQPAAIDRRYEYWLRELAP